MLVFFAISNAVMEASCASLAGSALCRIEPEIVAARPNANWVGNTTERGSEVVPWSPAMDCGVRIWILWFHFVITCPNGNSTKVSWSIWDELWGYCGRLVTAWEKLSGGYQTRHSQDMFEQPTDDLSCIGHIRCSNNA